MNKLKILTTLFISCFIYPALAQTLDIADSAPLRRVDLSNIKNAIPRSEPASNTGNPAYYEVFGKRYHVLDSSQGYHKRGIASWYGTKFHGRRTSSGEPYNMFAMTAANPYLPIPCYVRVTNLENGKQIIVKVNDRGPFHDNRIIDLSYAAAHKLEMTKKGTAMVVVEAIEPFQYLAEPTQFAAYQRPQDDNELYLQIGAFGQHINALEYADDIRKVLVESNIKVHEDTLFSNKLYRVAIGPLVNHAQAEKLNQRLQKAGLAKGIIKSAY